MHKSLLLITLFWVGLAFSDPPELLWSRTYGGPQSEWCNSLELMDDGGFLLGGGSTSYGAGSYDIYIIRTDSLGNTLWARTYGGDQQDFCEAVIKLDAGEFAAAGHTHSYGSGGYDVYLVRADANGDTLWTMTYGGSAGDFCSSMLSTSDGGFVLAGSSDSFGSEDHDMYLLRVDSTGSLIWQYTYGEESIDEQCFSVSECSDGGYILGGAVGWTWDSILLLKTDIDGNQEWSRTFETSVCKSVIQTEDGGFLLAGAGQEPWYGRDMLLLKTDHMGIVLWSQHYDFGASDYCDQVLETADGDYLLAGYSTVGESRPTTWARLVRTDSQGCVEWDYYPGYTNTSFSTVVQTGDGGIAVGGVSDSSTIDRAEMLLQRLVPDASGLEGGEVQFNLEVPIPNPFSVCTNITFRMPTSGTVALCVYDLSGRLVETIADGVLQQGDHTVTFEGAGLNSGVYLIRLENSERTAFTRVILIR